MLIPSRMLIFDEPTNHLDVPMKDWPTNREDAGGATPAAPCTCSDISAGARAPFFFPQATSRAKHFALVKGWKLWRSKGYGREPPITTYYHIIARPALNHSWRKHQPQPIQLAAWKHDALGHHISPLDWDELGIRIVLHSWRSAMARVAFSWRVQSRCGSF